MKTSHFRLAAVLLVLVAALPSFAQYTDPVYISDLGGPQEFARRRTELAKQAKTGYIVLFARVAPPEANHYREDNDFFYYTGISDPGAVMVMDVSKGYAVIFEPDQGQRGKQVYGANLLAMTPEQREKLGYPAVMPNFSL